MIRSVLLASLAIASEHAFGNAFVPVNTPSATLTSSTSLQFGFLKDLGLKKPEFLPDFGSKKDEEEAQEEAQGAPEEPPAPVQVSTPSSGLTTTEDNQLLADIKQSAIDASEVAKANLKKSVRIAQESNAAGFNFKQVVADVLAGEAGEDFDRETILKEHEATIASNPLVMYTWKSSPACNSAINAFDVMGVEPKIVRLDDPWDEGNPVRATIGRKVKRSSVPMIFIGGKYIGGYDGGVETEDNSAGGMVDLSFRDKLRDMLSDAGVQFKSSEPMEGTNGELELRTNGSSDKVAEYV